MNNIVTCMGEILVNMIQSGKERTTFETVLGGSAANVSIGVSRLGGQSAFLGKVGNDSFGQYLKNILTINRVNIDGLKQGGRTGLAVVLLDDNKKKNFEFYEQLTTFNKSDINSDILDNTNIFHFCSNSLITKASRSATLQCLEYAKSKRITVSYSPNLNLKLWEDESNAKLSIRAALGYADILKISEDELEFLADTKNVDEGLNKLLNMSDQLKFIAITQGNKGCYYHYKNRRQLIPSIDVNVLDSEGAGDGFMAGLLYKLSNLANINELHHDEVGTCIKFANIAGALTTTKIGVINSLPTLNDVNHNYYVKYEKEAIATFNPLTPNHGEI